MTGCNIPNCENSSVKGFKMYRFPRNASRQEVWISQISQYLKNVSSDKLSKWKTSQNSALCEVHFSSDQFEQNRMDGRKKLKPNAVPTIFIKSAEKRDNAAKSESAVISEEIKALSFYSGSDGNQSQSNMMSNLESCSSGDGFKSVSFIDSNLSSLVSSDQINISDKFDFNSQSGEMLLNQPNNIFRCESKQIESKMDVRAHQQQDSLLPNLDINDFDVPSSLPLELNDLSCFDDTSLDCHSNNISVSQNNEQFHCNGVANSNRGAFPVTFTHSNPNETAYIIPVSNNSHSASNESSSKECSNIENNFTNSHFQLNNSIVSMNVNSHDGNIQMNVKNSDQPKVTNVSQTPVSTGKKSSITRRHSLRNVKRESSSDGWNDDKYSTSSAVNSALLEQLGELSAQNKALDRSNRLLKKQNLKLKQDKLDLEGSFKEVFTPDQLSAIGKKSTKGWQWSEETIKRAMALKINCGLRGYQELLRQNYPLPSLRTIQRRLVPSASQSIMIPDTLEEEVTQTEMLPPALVSRAPSEFTGQSLRSDHTIVTDSLENQELLANIHTESVSDTEMVDRTGPCDGEQQASTSGLQRSKSVDTFITNFNTDPFLSFDSASLCISQAMDIIFPQFSSDKKTRNRDNVPRAYGTTVSDDCLEALGSSQSLLINDSPSVYHIPYQSSKDTDDCNASINSKDTFCGAASPFSNTFNNANNLPENLTSNLNGSNITDSDLDEDVFSTNPSGNYILYEPKSSFAAGRNTPLVLTDETDLLGDMNSVLSDLPKFNSPQFCSSSYLDPLSGPNQMDLVSSINNSHDNFFGLNNVSDCLNVDSSMQIDENPRQNTSLMMANDYLADYDLGNS